MTLPISIAVRHLARALAPVFVLALSACGGGPAGSEVVGGEVGGGHRGEGDVGHGVLLVVVDGLRADHLGCYGHDRDTSPHLDALAESGALFESAIAAAPLLEPALCALVSGCDPNLARRRLPGVHGRTDTHSYELPETLPTMAVEFAVAGYRTAAFVDDETFVDVRGLRRGFHEVRFEDDPALRRENGPFEEAIEWVRSHAASESWFACVHVADVIRAFRDPHPEWDSFFEPRSELWWIPPVGANEVNFHAVPPERWEGGTLPLSHYDARYDGAIRRLDAELKQLFDRLETAGRFERTTVCFVGTHGMQFGEAGMLLDHGLLAPADVHVPLIVRPAAKLGRPFETGARRLGAASTLDLAPTLLDLSGVPVPAAMHGTSLVPRLARADGVAELERAVMASCGLITGTAAYTHDLALEHLVPGLDVPAGLREQWAGRPTDGGLEVRCYAWREPGLEPLLATPEPPTGREADAARLNAAQSRWYQSFVIEEYARVWGTQ